MDSSMYHPWLLSHCNCTLKLFLTEIVWHEETKIFIIFYRKSLPTPVLEFSISIINMDLNF